MGEAVPGAGTAALRTWRKAPRLSSLATRIDAALDGARLDRGPWLAVAFAAGIACWFWLDAPWQWQGAIGAAVLVALAAQARWRSSERRAALLVAVTSCAIAFAFGVGLVWARSEVVGVRPLDGPRFGLVDGRVLEREERPGENRLRLVLALRDAREGRAVKVRVNLTPEQDRDGLREGAIVRLRARLMPPAPPLVPGGYDFARSAWFSGLAATGSALGDIAILRHPPEGGAFVAKSQRALSHHVRAQLPGSAGTLAATLASGDRGAIPSEVEAAMRDSGLAHLLSISGVHVGAVMAFAYALVFRLLALWPWLALRWRLPIVAASGAALAGIAYTLLTGAEVPTVRTCIGALLVLTALVLGREPLSIRLVAVAACAVLMLWPEALVGPSFQMSFAAVLAIVALHQSAPVRRFLAPREEGWASRAGRRAVMLLVTGLVIEIALMPVVLFHFHRAGVYGALANLVAIPLVTFVSMPLVAFALLADLVGAGKPFWWLAGQSLDALLLLADTVAAAPRAVTLVPQVGAGWVLLFAAGGLWLALWRGAARAWGLVPLLAASGAMAASQPPDILVTRDGRNFAVAGAAAGRNGMIVMRAGRSDSYTQETLAELAAHGGTPLLLDRWDQARCSADFCSFALRRDDRTWRFLVARSRIPIEERALAAACAQSDIVIADRWLPRSCQPRWLKADRDFLDRNGGLALHLSERRIVTVAQSQGDHGWWQPRSNPVRRYSTRPQDR